MNHAKRDRPNEPTAPADRARRKTADRALVEKTKAGDRRAFGVLVETYQRRVYAIAFCILRSRDLPGMRPRKPS